MTASSFIQSAWLRRLAIVLAALALPALAGVARAGEPVRGEVTALNERGYTRMVFRLDEEVSATIRVNFPIMVVTFKKAVDVPVDRLNENAPNVISAARVDPDHTAIRIALAKRVRVNTIRAAERLYVDLLPDDWTGVMPGLPQEVIEDLAHRARVAERKLRRQQITDRARTVPTVRVKVATQPTFVRYVFELPDQTNVVPDQQDDRLTLNFDRQIKWDLGDAVAAMPPTVKSVEGTADAETATVRIVFNGTPTVRTFREARSIAVDVGVEGAAPEQAVEAGDAPTIAPPETVPTKDAAAKMPAASPGEQADDGLPPLIDVPAPAKNDKAKDAKTKDAKKKAAAPAPAMKKPAEPHQAMAKPPAAPKVDEPAPPQPMHKAETKPAPDAAQPMAKPEARLGEKDGGETSPADAAPKPMTPASTEPPKAEVAPTPVAQEKKAPSAPKAVKADEKAKVQSKAAEAEPQQKAADAEPPPPKAPSAAPAAPAPNPDAPVVAELQRAGDTLNIEFPFALPTPAAVFRRADVLWLVFDNAARVDLSALTREAGKDIREARFARAKDGAGVVRLKLKRPRMVSATADGPSWIVTLGDKVTTPTRPLDVARSIVGKNRASIIIPFDGPRAVHAIHDPAVGDELVVVTALGPARGFLKTQEFVELRALLSTHGIVLQPLADDLAAQLSVDKVTVSRPSGLALSPTAIGQQQLATSFRALSFDTQLWGFDRQAKFIPRQAELIRNAAMAPKGKRRKARLDLARFYLAKGMSAEAKAVLDVTLADARGEDDVTGTVLKAVANVMLDRPAAALKDLAKPQIGNQLDAPVWRAIAYARQGKWAEAHKRFTDVKEALAALPIELQRLALRERLHAAIEVRDFQGAGRVVDELQTVGVPDEMQASIAVLVGQLDEGLGRNEDALTNYRTAAKARDQRAAAQARLREAMLRFAIGDLKRKEVIAQLETQTTVWRGDETEAEGLKLLAHLYTEDSRYREAFHVMRAAMLAHPNSDLTRKIQDEATTTFESLFLNGKGDALPPVEALALFYDYRQLTPIGRRGDEMIRKLADRLVGVDLLDQAAELLQHQVDHRLHGAARAQVATRLATIYLMNRKPKLAQQALRKSHSSELANELRDQRLLLEARALSEIGRHDLALEMIASIQGREATRLRADILWAAKRWRQAAEQIELLHGARWREFSPLTESERVDILRAAIGFAMADEAIALQRLREKYAGKMADTPDRHAFEVVTAPIGVGGPAFKDVARKVAGVDTLNAFLADMRTRYPEKGVAPAPNAAGKQAGPAPEPSPPKTQPADAAEHAKKPKAEKSGKAEKSDKPDKAALAKPDPAASPVPPKVPAGAPLKADGSPTGSIERLLRERATRR